MLEVVLGCRIKLGKIERVVISIVIKIVIKKAVNIFIHKDYKYAEKYSNIQYNSLSRNIQSEYGFRATKALCLL